MSFGASLDDIDRDANLGSRRGNLTPYTGHKTLDGRPIERTNMGHLSLGETTDAQYSCGPTYGDFECESKGTGRGERCKKMEHWASYGRGIGCHNAIHDLTAVPWRFKEIKQNGECSTPILDEHSLDSSDGEIPNPSVDVVSILNDGDEIRQAFMRRAGEHPSFVKHLEELREEIEARRAPAELLLQQRGGVGSGRSDDGHDFGKAPCHVRFVVALGKLFKKAGKAISQAVTVIYKKITACFNVAKPIAGKNFRAIKMGLLWIVRAIVDPQGEIRAILDDSERSKWLKTIEVIGVIVVATLGALIMSFGTAGTGPFGVGTATVGVAVASGTIRRQPRDGERL